MGGGTYSYTSAMDHSEAKGYSTKSVHEVFTQKHMASKMNPFNVKVREARDSDEHPLSFPIVLALDVTGSMGSIPHYLVSKGLPALMDKVITAGVKDPQVLFLGIGDHECDRAPLQVSQFESSDQLLDKWLTELYVESGGGGNDGESYLLAWLFAGRHTSTDHGEIRGKRGLLVTIGDEPTLTQVPKEAQRKILGDGQYADVSAAELLHEARTKYEVYHLHMLEGQNGMSKKVQDGWKQLMGDHVIFVEKKEDVARVVAELVIKTAGAGAAKAETVNSEEVLL